MDSPDCRPPETLAVFLFHGTRYHIHLISPLHGSHFIRADSNVFDSEHPQANKGGTKTLLTDRLGSNPPHPAGPIMLYIGVEDGAIPPT